MKGNVLITGGTGMLGSALTTELLKDGYSVRYLSRSKKQIPNVEVFTWDIKEENFDPAAFDNIDYIVHLAGAGIADHKWTEAYKKEILDSRVLSTRLLLKGVYQSQSKLQAFISASAIGIYGLSENDELFFEDSKKGEGFIAEVTKQWESEVDAFSALTRIVKLRIGIVLTMQGGALPKLVQPIKWLLGAPLASGDQYISWIHIDDVIGMFKYAIENRDINGAYNAVAPSPITNSLLTKEIAKVLNKPLFLPNVPGFVLKMMVGDMADVVIYGNNVSNNKIVEAGYSYKFSNLRDALSDLVN